MTLQDLLFFLLAVCTGAAAGYVVGYDAQASRREWRAVLRWWRQNHSNPDAAEYHAVPELSRAQRQTILELWRDIVQQPPERALHGIYTVHGGRGGGLSSQAFVVVRAFFQDAGWVVSREGHILREDRTYTYALRRVPRKEG